MKKFSIRTSFAALAFAAALLGAAAPAQAVKPDLKMVKAWVAYEDNPITPVSQVCPGDKLVAVFTYKNNSQSNITKSYINCCVRDDGWMKSVKGTKLKKKKSATQDIEFTAGPEVGQQRITIHLDYGQAIAESKENNNKKTVTFIVLEPELELGSNEREFGPEEAKSRELSVKGNVRWTARSSSGWLRVRRDSGRGNGRILYDVDEQAFEDDRTGTITVSGGGLTRTFTVTQKGVVLELGASEREFEKAGGSGRELSVTANVAWTAKSSVPWLKLKKSSGNGNGAIIYDVAANPWYGETGYREGTITVSGSRLTRTFTVKQQGGKLEMVELTLGATSRTLGWEATNGRELSVKANVAWTAEASAGWIRLRTTGGTGNGTILYGLTANTGSFARVGTITVKGGLTQTFTITQSAKNATTIPGGWHDVIGAPSLALGASERTFTAEAANGRELKVTANVSWTATSSASWLKVRTAGGSGNGSILYNVAANTGSGSRTGTITVSSGGLSRTFTVTQSGKKAKAKRAGAKEIEPAWVTTSDKADGGAVLDGDEGTGWGPVGAGGGWLVLTYPEAVAVKDVAVKGDGLPGQGVRVLLSEDADDWLEGTEGRAQYVWVILPEEAEGATVTEIAVETE
jgi:hypothetical protein